MSLCDIPDLACKGSKRGIPVNQPAVRICRTARIRVNNGWRFVWVDVVCEV